MREAGYSPKARPFKDHRPVKTEFREGEHSFVRPLQGLDYPRFHIYLQENREKGEVFLSIHLDQKKPVYQRAHNAEYQGELVEKELTRLKTFYENN